MPYKLIALDMDGTVLGSDKKLSPGTLSAIKQAMDRGIIVTISTGRPIVMMGNYREILDMVGTPIITYNGAKVVDPRDQRVLYQENLDKRAAADIFRRGEAFGTVQCVWSNDRLYISKHNEKTEQYAEAGEVESALITDIDAILAQGITKILWIDDAPVIARYQEELAGALPEGVTSCTSSPYFLEFFSNKASKGLALQFLGEYHTIAQSEIIAVGDADNDIPMLEYAGLGVAMGNATEAIKAGADFVTLTNDEGGVAHVIEKFLLFP